MKQYILFLSLIIFFAGPTTTNGQSDIYRYQLNLNNVVDDQLKVELQTPRINSKTIRFYMPNIIPGTYRESNYGMFVTNLKAYNKRGRELPVQRLGKNTWKIEKAHKMKRLSYFVEDTYDTQKEHKVYGMSGTNIDSGEHFMVYSSGFFGYFEGMKEHPFEVSITKPETFYGSTGMIPTSSSATEDVYLTHDYDMLIDSPMMYNKPDTTIMNVANAEVLVSVYSPNGMITSEFLAEQYKPLMEAHADYLGGELPVGKYAFILYFNEPEKIESITGAHEHSYSSVFYLREMPQERIAPLLTDIASHEFYHIVTPLNIHSEEVAYFNYNEPDLSKHLWLYEGVTEYVSHHVQVTNNMISDREFLKRMEKKINTSKQNFDDKLAFTELSTYAAGKYNEEYPNVYQKGALIGAMLDLKIIESTDGAMNLQDLIDALSKKYGDKKPFKDDELFDVITEMTAPEVGEFFDKYVASPNPLPLKQQFEKIGVTVIREEDSMVPSYELEALTYAPKQNRMKVTHMDKLTSFGKELGLKKEDIVLKIQDAVLDPMKGMALIDSLSTTISEGETVTWTVSRLQEDGKTRKEVTLSAEPLMSKKEGNYRLSVDENSTEEQLRLRHSWLHPDQPFARKKDVGSIDGIINAMYDVISGPAGERDWERNASLFKPGAMLAALGKDKEGELQYVTMSQEEYRKRNEKFFMENDFWEEEIARRVFRFGEMATVQTAYKFRLGEDNSDPHRGVNSVQLVYDRGRWWITNITWNSERDDNPIPEELLPGGNTTSAK